jgi:hypothetical protein
MNSQNDNGSTGHTGGGHFIDTVRHVHVLDHGHFTINFTWPRGFLGCLHQIYTGLKQHNYRHLSIGWGKLSSLQTSITFFN